jgi:hypothetical protein
MSYQPGQEIILEQSPKTGVYCANCTVLKIEEIL